MVKSIKRSSIISTLSSTIYPWSTDDGGDEALLDEQLGMWKEKPPSPLNPEIQRLISEFLEAETSDKMELEGIIDHTAKAIHAEMKVIPAQSTGSSDSIVQEEVYPIHTPQRLQEILSTQLLISQLKREIVVEVKLPCHLCSFLPNKLVGMEQ